MTVAPACARAGGQTTNKLAHAIADDAIVRSCIDAPPVWHNVTGRPEFTLDFLQNESNSSKS
jgi:hypothetical protein